jgi:hypothetical protein
MSDLTHREVHILAEKEDGQAVQVEHMPSVVEYKSAELEPRMNLQTCMAFLVSHFWTTLISY